MLVAAKLMIIKSREEDYENLLQEFLTGHNFLN